MTASVLVDIQNDFGPGGALRVPVGNQIIPIFISSNPGDATQAMARVGIVISSAAEIISHGRNTDFFGSYPCFIRAQSVANQPSCSIRGH